MYDKFSGEFITLAEFAYLAPLNVFHRESEKPEYSHPDGLKNLHITFARDFTLDKLPQSASLHFSADDYVKLYVNDRYAGQGPAQGYYFDYNHCVADVTSLLREGENIIRAEVYYQGLINRAYDSGDLRCGFICGLVSDGEILLSTDADWRCRVDKSYVGRDKTGYDTQFLEHRDLRIPPTEWERVRVRDADYTFADKPFPMLDVYPVDPRAFCERNGSIVYDFGGEVVGGLVVTVTAKRDGAELDCAVRRKLDGGVEGRARSGYAYPL